MFLNPNKELESIMFSYSRPDVKNWKRWKLRAGAMTILIPKIITLVGIFVGGTFVINLMMIGAPPVDKPMPNGLRKTTILVWSKTLAWI